jgi:hypothetical protein
MQLNHDQPLSKMDALEPGKDKLERRGFAESVVQALAHVNKDRGLVLSIEGKWGSGKSSTLAMVEALLDLEATKPLVVHFNPWLVGDRDALLGQFLSKVGKAAKLSDHGASGKRVAKEIAAYSHAFDIVKLIPGAEPWATIVKSVFTSVGSATGAIADYKTPDLEDRKQKVVEALKTLPQPIIVVVDDFDRLFPKEVFEMVRIIKAVGDLPNIGYLLAWDAAYIESALKSADISAADIYLDKIVQVRMSLPALSNHARSRLFDDAYKSLPAEATNSHFPGDQELLPELHQYGLKQFLEQPRDIARLFNLVQLREAKLRGNVVLADLIGWAALLLYAPLVAELVKSEFDSKQSIFEELDDQIMSDVDKDKKIQNKTERHTRVILETRNPDAIINIIRFLFPTLFAENGHYIKETYRGELGRISNENCFRIVVQWGASDSEIDLIKAQQFILEPAKRTELIAGLSNQNCFDFLDAVNGMSLRALKNSSDEKLDLFLAIAQSLDQEPFAARTKNERTFTLRSNYSLGLLISEVMDKLYQGHGHEVAERIVSDPKSLSMATTLLDSYWLHLISEDKTHLVIDVNDRSRLIEIYANNVLLAVETAEFWNLAIPGRILKTVTQCDSDLPQQIFSKIKKIDPNLDRFAEAFIYAGHSTAGGDYFEFNDFSHPSEYNKLCPIEELKAHAEQRLLDPALDFPARAAWMAVASGKKIYASGEEARL